jgi:hypothetical protein
MFARNGTLVLFPPTDMARRKPRPPPLAYSRALIENERLAVIQRTAHRKHQLTGDTTDTNPTGKYLPYAKTVAFGVIFLILTLLLLGCLPCIVIAPVTVISNYNCNVLCLLHSLLLN